MLARAGGAALFTHSESDMADVLKSLALAGQGLAWLPTSAAAAELADGRLVRAGGEAWCLDLEILFVFSRNNDAVRNLMEKHAG